LLRATHFHIDSSNVRKDRNGRLHVTGRLTRTGVFPYYVGGKKMLELRPESAVFDPHALETLKAAPVTVDHPRAFVTPRDEEVVGTVTNVYVDPPYVTGEMVINDETTIKLVEAGKLTEISLGYETDLEKGDSEEYDLVQNNIRYNHAALGGPGWSRMGDTLLHLDGTSHFIMDTAMQDETKLDQAEPAVEATPEAVEATPEATEVPEAAEAAVEVDTDDIIKPEEAEAAEKPAEATEAEPSEETKDEEKPEVDLVAMDSKLDRILDFMAKFEEKTDSADVPRLDSDEFKAAVKEAVDAALEAREPKQREYSKLKEAILGELPQTKGKFSKLRAHVLGDE
jgi:hypothetical protein